MATSSAQFPPGFWVEFTAADGKAVALDIIGLYCVEEVGESVTAIRLVSGSYVEIRDRIAELETAAREVGK